MTRVEKQICRILSGTSIDKKILHPEFADDILTASIRHGVHGLLYFALKEQNIFNSLPKNVQHDFRKVFTQQVAVDLHREQILLKVLNRCAQNHIFPIIIKGEALSRTYYSYSATRERGDIDLFIDLSTIRTMKNIMTELGFFIKKPIYKSHQFTCIQRQADIGNNFFDIHWRVSNIAAFARIIKYEEAFKHSVPVFEISHGITLSEKDSLLLACMHIAGIVDVVNERLIWFYDIHLLILAMDEGAFVQWAEYAVQKHVQEDCLQVVLKTNQFFDTPIPDTVRSILSNKQAGFATSQKIVKSNLSLILYDLKEIPGITGKSYLLLELLVPPPKRLLDKYKKTNMMWLPFLYCRQIIEGICSRLMLR